jgi:hypothetical protein
MDTTQEIVISDADPAGPKAVKIYPSEISICRPFTGNCSALVSPDLPGCQAMVIASIGRSYLRDTGAYETDDRPIIKPPSRLTRASEGCKL